MIQFLKQLIEYLEKIDSNEREIAELRTRISLLESGEKLDTTNNFSKKTL